MLQMNLLILIYIPYCLAGVGCIFADKGWTLCIQIMPLLNPPQLLMRLLASFVPGMGQNGKPRPRRILLDERASPGVQKAHVVLLSLLESDQQCWNRVIATTRTDRETAPGTEGRRQRCEGEMLFRKLG